VIFLNYLSNQADKKDQKILSVKSYSELARVQFRYQALWCWPQLNYTL